MCALGGRHQPGSTGRHDAAVAAVVRVHEWSDRTLIRAVSATRGIHDGLWLGIASSDALHAIDDAYYRRDPEYNEESGNERGLFPWEEAVLGQFFDGCLRLAVTAAGGGREVLALLRRGYRPQGFECNLQLVNVANRVLDAAGFEARVSVVPRDSWPVGSTVYDGVIVGWGSYTLMQTRARRVEFLRRARAQVGPGAPLLVSFFTRKGAPAYFRLAVGVANAVRKVRGAEPAELGDTVRPNYVHFFTQSELEDELACGGFKVVHYAEDPYAHAVALALP